MGDKMGDKKSSGTDNQVGQLAEQMADRVKESANQIWLAGLGAYSKAEEEGSKLFDALVQDGEKLEARTRAIVDKPLTVAKEKVETVRARATGSWEKVEKAFDIRVSKALHRLNIPTRADVDLLTQRISELEAQLEQIEKAAAKAVKK
ncbi:phasin family protein [Ketobacter sp.]|uniref:phasin family protein n=1 Tax=Ketobacter sp. TaxID=2083498 RepID=UPI0025BBC495|nr:phasin family protein [Ketobacter sp.]